MWRCRHGLAGGGMGGSAGEGGLKLLAAMSLLPVLGALLSGDAAIKAAQG